MDAISSIASRRGIPVIEDNAHGLFGKYRGRPLGTFGALATQSFHETKNVMCGEGGALVINDARHVERAEIVREKGTNRARFFRGEVDKYSWMDLGSSYVPSDILAAFLHAQLEARAEIQRRRRAIWELYRDRLREWADANGVRLPIVPEHCEQAYHMFYVLLPSFERRQAFIEHIRRHGILAVFHYVPLHLSPMGRSFGYSDADLPVTRQVSERLVRLPFFNDLSVTDQERIVDAIRLFRC
jgi:dTDP-4-amino-4,6-dideoxygalactose transaminase